MAAHVIGDLIGVPPAARVGILAGDDGLAYGPRTPGEMAAAFAEVRRNVEALIQAKRRTPGDDLATDLIAAQEEDGSRLSDDELTAMLLLLLNTGTEPAMNLITNAVCALLTHPDQRELVRTGQATWHSVIEETLRAEAPVAHLPFRFAVQDVEVGGVRIAKGEPVLMNFAAVGRDPVVHGDNAAGYDLARTDKRHLSFGHGSYRCVGSALAWLEAEIALDALFTRFPDLTLAVAPHQLEPQATFIMNGRRALPVYLCAAPLCAAPPSAAPLSTAERLTPPPERLTPRPSA
jgi:cytochrome P450